MLPESVPAYKQPARGSPGCLVRMFPAVEYIFRGVRFSEAFILDIYPLPGIQLRHMDRWDAYFRYFSISRPLFGARLWVSVDLAALQLRDSRNREISSNPDPPNTYKYLWKIFY